MTINPCKECGAPVSNKAESCPMCGAKQPKKTSMLTWFMVVLLGAGALIWMYLPSGGGSASSQPSPETQKMMEQAAIQVAIKNTLKDPDSARFEFLNAKCGTVNAKNSFGGYAGAKRFVSDGATVYVDGDDGFKKAWKEHCTM